MNPAVGSDSEQGVDLAARTLDSRSTGSDHQLVEGQADTKTCPDCAEDIKAAALVCRYCGFRFDRPNTNADEADRVTPSTDTEPQRSTIGQPRSWRRIAAYVASIGVWLASTPAAAVSVYEEDTTEDHVLSWIAAPITALAVASLIRGVYVLIRKRPMLSPWLFVIAAAFSVLASLGE